MALFPKLIWTYWHNINDIPNFVWLCLESWKKHNPHYKIMLLTKGNYKQFVSIPDSIVNHPHFNDSHQRFSDLIRLFVIAEHGGIWSDASIFMTQPLDEWFTSDFDEHEFSAFYINKFSTKCFPAIENWFFGAIKDSIIIRKWKDEFLNIMNFKNCWYYADFINEMGVELGIPWVLQNYLAMNLAMQKILQIDHYPQNKLMLRTAETDIGPLKYQMENEWNSLLAVKCCIADKMNLKPFIKFTGPGRFWMNKWVNNRIHIDLSLKYKIVNHEFCGVMEMESTQDHNQDISSLCVDDIAVWKTCIYSLNLYLNLIIRFVPGPLIHWFARKLSYFK